MLKLATNAEHEQDVQFNAYADLKLALQQSAILGYDLSCSLQ